MRGRRTLCVVGVAAILLSSDMAAQTVSRDQNSFDVAVSFFAPLVFPKIIQDGYRLKEYIVSEEFARVRRERGDAAAVDAIFERASTLSWNNYYEALLISLVATMDHRRFGVRLPVLGPLLWAPLTSEFPEEFAGRVNALPSKLYADTPVGEAGDRDKLQHFFGSAFLTYLFESSEVAERFGTFVEMGEEAFIVDGVLDERDFRANKQGEEFGLRLLEDGHACPSSFLKPFVGAQINGEPALHAPCDLEE